MPEPDQNSPKVSRAYANYVFVLLFLLYMFDYIDRMIVASLFPFLKQDWGLTDTQCGMLVSSVYWSIIVFTLPISWLIDRWSRKKSIGLMALLWSLATASCAFTRGFGQLFTARVAIGVGEAGYAPGGTALISALYPQKKRAQIMGIWNASIPLGSAIGIVLGAVIAERWGWRHAFGIVAIPGFIIAVLFFFVKDYQTVDLQKTVRQSGSKHKMRLKEIFRGFWKTRSLILTFLAFAGNAFVTTSLISWLPTFFHRTYGLSMSQASLKSGSIMLLAIIGAPLGGYLTDRWYQKRKDARMLFAAISSISTSILLAIAFWFLTGTAQYVVLIFSGVTLAAFVPAAAAATQDVVHPGVRALSYSVCVVVQNLLGASLGPVFVGAISDRFGISTALSLLPFFACIAGILFFAGSFFYVRDLNKVEKISLTFEG